MKLPESWYRRTAVLVLTLLVSAWFSATPAHAAAHNGEITLSGSYSDTEGAGTVANVTGEALAPFGPGLIGPAIAFTYHDPDKGRSVTGTGFGATYELNLLKKSFRPFLGGQGLYWTGNFRDAVSHELSIRGGVKVLFGDNERVYFKGFASRARQFGHGADRDSTDVVFGFGFLI